MIRTNLFGEDYLKFLGLGAILRILRVCRETSSVAGPNGVDKGAQSLVVFGTGPIFQCATSIHRVGMHPVDGFFDILRRQTAGEIELWNELADLLCN